MALSAPVVGFVDEKEGGLSSDILCGPFGPTWVNVFLSLLNIVSVTFSTDFSLEGVTA